MSYDATFYTGEEFDTDADEIDDELAPAKLVVEGKLPVLLEADAKLEMGVALLLGRLAELE